MSRVKISELRAQVLEANQCAARALEGRDQMIREVQRLEQASKGLPALVNLEREQARKNAVNECNAAYAKLAVARAQLRLMRAQMRLLKTSG